MKPILPSLVAVAVLTAGLSATPASAQFARAGAPPPPNPMGNIATERARQDTFRNDETGIAARERRERERVMQERAERLAAMVNAGQCHEAHRVALAEGDTAMAQRIATVCAGGE